MVVVSRVAGLQHPTPAQHTRDYFADTDREEGQRILQVRNASLPQVLRASSDREVHQAKNAEGVANEEAPIV